MNQDRLMSPAAATSASISDSTPQVAQTADRIGVVASVLCAIHCAVTPFLLLLLPTFGRAWSHPATHWGMALLVVPLAGFMMSSGYKEHRCKWIVGVGTLGIAFVLAGSAAPYLEGLPQPAAETAKAGGHVCSDGCCPSLHRTADAGWHLHVPSASILTTLGGAMLIVTHIGNLRLCRCGVCQTPS